MSAMSGLGDLGGDELLDIEIVDVAQIVFCLL
jgi:hypothetical protein